MLQMILVRTQIRNMLGGEKGKLHSEEQSTIYDSEQNTIPLCVQYIGTL